MLLLNLENQQSHPIEYRIQLLKIDFIWKFLYQQQQQHSYC